MVHAFQLLFTDCNYPKAFVWWIGLHAVMFYFLFSDFYKQTYNKQKTALAKKVQHYFNSAYKVGQKLFFTFSNLLTIVYDAYICTY